MKKNEKKNSLPIKSDVTICQLSLLRKWSDVPIYNLPLYFTHFSINLISLILDANEAFVKFALEKDIAIEIVRAVKASPNFKIGKLTYDKYIYFLNRGR